MPRLGMRRLRENADFEANDLAKADGCWSGRPHRWFISKLQNAAKDPERPVLVNMRGKHVRVHIRYLVPLNEEAAAFLAACRLVRSEG